ncbi:thiosulfate oxidation carrier complex protein SoxZ [Methylophaga nitratireducenticrescens]|uniref:Sulfur oxidation protein SoxZ n=1 Tax=Methylophaga nitratireducenticrescens TaxID=754476 RepID=I1XH32_METNJ|nr:thiosulfate oxidation carrier complex protein SoxZ [Methylophaga nitratireducenticrescens]AFI83701.1 thiosulfate oxidation carrier complex protein SoxZ [Methylophaga nitratireducenticrescens]AUZ83828.1 thiosulfate oxidation carrier complex protein SoxZ [Methylophaga nitratireducenticrescens]
MTINSRDRIRAKLLDGNTFVRILLSHPMHTGRGKNEQDELIPAEFIQDIRCWRNEEEVLVVKCGTATSRNPYFAFQLTGGEVGDKIRLRWVDNVGAKGTAETKVV